MNPFRNHTGTAALLDRSDVDTDQIIPKQFLTRVARTGYGPFTFFDWRYAEGTDCAIDDASGDYVFREKVVNPDFELNQGEYQGATVLITRNNFGCGSSREHAVWAIAQDGYQVVIAPRKGDLPGFADIFRSNSFKNGLMTVELSEPEVNRLFEVIRANPVTKITVDLPSQSVTFGAGEGDKYYFRINPGIKQRLLGGIDDIGKTLLLVDKISQHEEGLAKWV